MQISFLILAFVLIALIPCAAYRIPRTKPTGRMGKIMNSWEEFDHQPNRDYPPRFELSELRRNLHTVLLKFRLRDGWNRAAIPILTRYRATIGAAKMHMFMMSVVGVTMAAIPKMMRIE